MAIIQNKPNMNYGVWGSNGNIAVPTSEKVDLGWIIEKPPNEVMNWVQNRQDSMLQFINQRGIPTWDALTEYPLNAYVVRNGTLYKSVSQNIDKDPTLNSAIWNVAFATYIDYSNLYNEVQSIKGVEGYLDLYVSKNNPVMLGEANGVGYKDSIGDSGLTFSGTTPQITVSNDVVVSFKKLTDISEKSDAVATTMWVQDLIESLGAMYAPTGSIVAMATRVVPTGYLECNGNTLSRTTYSKLFSVVGTTFGAGDGATTFNLPDLRGEFIRGLDSGRGVDQSRQIGTQQGDAIRNITGEFQSTDDNITANVLKGAFYYTGRAAGTGAGGSGSEPVVGFDVSRQVPTANENRPRNIALLYIIKT